MVEEALQFFRQMCAEGVLPDKYTCVSILNTSLDGLDLAEGKQLHSLIVKGVFQCDTVVVTALTKMYSSHGILVESRRLFDTMQMRDLVAWNAMIAAYAQHAQGADALALSQQMHIEGVMLDEVTILVLLSVCADPGMLVVGKQAHVRIINMHYGFLISVGNSLVTMYRKCGIIDQAIKVFDKMPERDVISWNTLIIAYVQQGQVPSMLPLWIVEQMQVEGVIPNKVTLIGLFDMCNNQAHAAVCSHLHTFILRSDLELDRTIRNAIVNAYGKCGSLWLAQEMFQKMLERDEFAWNAIISAHAEHGKCREAFELFRQMQMEGMLPNKLTYLSIIDTCANDANLSEGKWAQVQVVGNSFETDVVIATALSDMYGKCGLAEGALSCFNIMPGRDVVSWNAMAKIYSQHGLGMQALGLFEQISSDMAPNTSTFSSLLGACSHAGLVQEGCRCFVLITQEFDLTPTLKHHNIIIDSLGRAGNLDKVEAVLHVMPCQPSTTSWLTLLDVCRKYSDESVGSSAAEHIFELDSANAAACIMLSYVFATSS